MGEHARGHSLKPPCIAARASHVCAHAPRPHSSRLKRALSPAPRAMPGAERRTAPVAPSPAPLAMSVAELQTAPRAQVRAAPHNAAPQQHWVPSLPAAAVAPPQSAQLAPGTPASLPTWSVPCCGPCRGPTFRFRPWSRPSIEREACPVPQEQTSYFRTHQLR